MLFYEKYQSNAHTGFLTIWTLIFMYYLSWPGAGSQSRSRNFDIPAPAPAPAKSSGSMRPRLRLHNTAPRQQKKIHIFPLPAIRQYLLVMHFRDFFLFAFLLSMFSLSFIFI